MTARRRLWLAAALGVWLAGAGPVEMPPPAPADAAAFSLDALLEGMATASGVAASFREVKEIGLLAEPIESRGVLYFVPPDRMARHTTAPGRASLIIDGDRFRFRDEAGGEDVDLSGNPVAREFVANMVVLWSGDREELERRYHVGFSGDRGAWQLALRPRHAPVRDLIASITLLGAERALRQVVIAETDGDTTTTHFERVDTDRRFDADELARAFEPGGVLAAP